MWMKIIRCYESHVISDHMLFRFAMFRLLFIVCWILQSRVEILCREPISLVYASIKTKVFVYGN